MKNLKIFYLSILAVTISSASAAAQDSWGSLTSGLTGAPIPEPYVSTLWNGKYEKPICEIMVGYVNKSLVCTYETNGECFTQREDFFGEKDKFLHGIQIGALFTPSFDWGLGLRTGAFFEGYVSRSEIVRYYGYSSYSEADLYVPLHASFRIPFDDEIALSLYGGMGFQLAMSGRYFKPIGTAWTWWRRPVPIGINHKMEFGYGWPQQVNWQAECGLNFRLRMVTFNFTYSFGIIDQGIQNCFNEEQGFITASKSRQDKMQATIAIAF